MRSKAKVSIFDLDHTLLKGNSSFLFGSFLYQKAGFSLLSLVYSVGCYGLHKAGGLSLQSTHERLFNRLFKGSSVASVKQIAAQFVVKILPSLFYEPVLSRLREAQSLGHRTIILSSGPDFLVSEIVSWLNVEEWQATPYRVDQQRFSSLGTVFCGQEKRRYLNHLLEKDGFEREAVYAYSDSHLDLPLLEAAGHPVGVNPDRVLRSICMRRGWEIL